MNVRKQLRPRAAEPLQQHKYVSSSSVYSAEVG